MPPAFTGTGRDIEPLCGLTPHTVYLVVTQLTLAHPFEYPALRATPVIIYCY